MFIIVAGGGRVGYYLVKELISYGHEVVLIEKDHDRCRQIIEELGNLVIKGDSCDPRILEKSGVQRADLIIANTGEDEDNLIICQVARKKFKVPGTIARVNNPKNDEIFRKLGIDATVSSIKAILSVIEQKVAHKGLMVSLTKIGDVEIVETRLTQKSPAVGKSLEKVPLPAGCSIAAVIRGGESLAVTPDLVFRINDIVITLAKIDDFISLKNALMG